jgi:hypothetical protein
VGAVVRGLSRPSTVYCCCLPRSPERPRGPTPHDDEARSQVRSSSARRKPPIAPVPPVARGCPKSVGDSRRVAQPSLDAPVHPGRGTFIAAEPDKQCRKQNDDGRRGSDHQSRHPVPKEHTRCSTSAPFWCIRVVRPDAYWQLMSAANGSLGVVSLIPPSQGTSGTCLALRRLTYASIPHHRSRCGPLGRCDRLARGIGSD